MLNIKITKEDVDRYFQQRPLKKYFLKKEGLLDEYYYNCINFPSSSNNINSPLIDQLSGPFKFASTTRKSQWFDIENDYKKFKKAYGKNEY